MASILSSAVRRLRLPTPATSQPRLLSFVFLLGGDMVSWSRRERESEGEGRKWEKRERKWEKRERWSDCEVEREEKWFRWGGNRGDIVDIFFFNGINEWSGGSGGYPTKKGKSITRPKPEKKYINEIRIRPNKSSWAGGRVGDRVGRICRAGRVSRIVSHPYGNMYEEAVISPIKNRKKYKWSR